MRVLLVEDDRKAARLLARGLQEEGFVVDVGYSGEMGDELARSNRYDLIVLDRILPGRDGLTVCRELRSRGTATPILVLTARDAISDRVSGLNAGADDYLTKPFAFDELLARIRALLRRSELTRPSVLTVGDIALDPAMRRVTRAGAQVGLTPKELAILEILMRHAGEVVTRSRIAAAVWEMEPDNLINLVDVHVSHLRRKIDGGRSRSLIHTVRGHGFRLTSVAEPCA